MNFIEIFVFFNANIDCKFACVALEENNAVWRENYYFPVLSAFVSHNHCLFLTKNENEKKTCCSHRRGIYHIIPLFYPI